MCCKAGDILIEQSHMTKVTGTKQNICNFVGYSYEVLFNIVTIFCDRLGDWQVIR